ncbi:MAG: hypothetical protein EA415_04450 [Sphaerobacteraceae bacterium]|nr:MAG: hypothetical protein EA415_04450 [Sphaerobacteraceae bacterium]
MRLNYTGNGAYCYANSLAMLLQHHGSPIEAWYLECLTAVGFGAAEEGTPEGPVVFFSNRLPDSGSSLALDTLGFQFTDHRCEVEDDPDGRKSLEKLGQLLEHGPVMAGPLDMGKLSYLPWHQHAGGADHYVSIFGLTPDSVRLHDPAGFPYITMPIHQFVEAWRADAIDYRAGIFGMWGNLAREVTPGPDEMFLATERAIAERYESAGSGADLIRKLATMAAQSALPDYLRGMMLNFSIPLGARRCADYARFFEPFNEELARLKDAQGHCFANVFVALRENRSPYDDLMTLADLEQQFCDSVLRAAHVSASR